MTTRDLRLHHEIEYKFRVPREFDLPDFSDVSAGVVTQPIRSMRATYFDTAEATLLRWGITMRHRTGGGDDGWHLKVPSNGTQISSAHTPDTHNLNADASARTEIHASGDPATPPAEFIGILGVLLRGGDLIPMAAVNTERHPLVLSDAKGPAVEIVDDSVSVWRGDTSIAQFREIEVELLRSDAEELAAQVVSELLERGAQVSSVSKAASAFGALVNRQPDVPDLPLPKKKDLPYDIIRWIISQRVRELLAHEVRSHLGEAEQAQLRLAEHLHDFTKLIRSLANVLNPDETQMLLDEADWVINELRASEVIHAQRKRAIESIANIQDPLDREEALVALDAYCDAKFQAAQSSATAARRSDRYFFFFSDLMDFARVPPVSDAGYLPQSMWDLIDPVHHLALSHCLAPIFPKMSKKIRKAHKHKESTEKSASRKTLDPGDVRELLREIALHGRTSPAGAFALGIAAGHHG